MEFTRCFRCMEVAERYPCPHCGYDPGKDKIADYVLPPQTILNGKYVVGTPLGQGGFGITYVGWDLALDCKVAIKEYFPAGQVVRDNATGSALRWLTTPQSQTAKEAGKEMFLKEARKMTRVRNIPQVVHVHDLFQENDTAYIVMDFVKGQTLKAHLAQTGPLSWDAAKAIFFPAIQAMEQVHQAGLVHRDLSPDNLMLLPDGSVQILDLGAAKDLNVNTGASSMQVAKSGFSPLEQYSQRGSSGPWTDVYAMAATIYFSLTGVVPPNAVDRVDDDPIRWDLPQLASLPNGVLTALKQAMAVSAKMRTQSIGELGAQLKKTEFKVKSAPVPKPAPKPIPKPKATKFPLPVIAAVLVLALVAGWVLWPTQTSTPQTESLPQTETQTEPENILSLPMVEQIIAASDTHTIAIKSDGTVMAAGNNDYARCDVSSWADVISVCANALETIGLKSDGTIISSSYANQEELSSWRDVVAICSGCCEIGYDSSYYSHIVGLRANGTVVATGSNSHGQCNISTWSGITAVCVGDLHTVGLRKDGTVVATGDNSYGQCNVSDWENIEAIYAGNSRTVGLRADGTLVATGESRNGECAVSDWTDIVTISMGEYHTVGLKADGTVVATGNNSTGQCGVSDWTDIVAISAGVYHTIGLRTDGTVVSAGYNSQGQCNVFSWTDIVSICAGPYHTIGLRTDGTMIATGNNRSGQCDLSDWTDIRIPGTAHMPETTVPAESESIFPLAIQEQTIAAGYGSTFAIQENGDLLARGWGYNAYPFFWSDIMAIDIGTGYVVGLKADGTVLASGHEECDTSDWKNIVAISAGMNHILGLKYNNTVVATGYYEHGQCDVSDWRDIVAVSAGGFHSVGLKADGTVVAAGYNKADQCDVSDWQNITAVSAGQQHTVGLKADGSVIATGDNEYGQCDVSDWRNIVAISAGAYYTIGLKTDGTVVATGYDNCGQCRVSSWKNIVAISAGLYHTVGLKADGTVVATGSNTNGQCDLSDWTSIRIPSSIN